MTPIDVIFPESARRYVDLQCNGDVSQFTSPDCYSAIREFIGLEQPRTCLELGCGLGRMSVFFLKKLNWHGTKFYLLDGDSGTVQISGVRGNRCGEFYNSLQATRDFCQQNGMLHPQVIREVSQIEQSIDMCYSFLSIGWHWSIELYLDSILDHLAEDSLVIFQIRNLGDTGMDHFREQQIQLARQHSAYHLQALILNSSKRVGSFLVLRKVLSS